MNSLWLVGQTGIIIELIGAAAGVYFAWNTRRIWSNLGTPKVLELSSIARQSKADAMAQYSNQMMSFGLIGIGLILQFIGNL